MRSSPKENQSLEVKVKGISEMEFSLSIFDYTFTNYIAIGYPLISSISWVITVEIVWAATGKAMFILNVGVKTLA